MTKLFHDLSSGTRNLGITAALLLTAGVSSAPASMLLTTGETYTGNINQSALSAELSIIDVGASDVLISGFGVKGNLPGTADLEWAIFANITGSSALFLSAPQLTAGGGGDQWYDSSALSFTLLAGHEYAMGLIADQSFTYDYDSDGAAKTANGLTAVANSNQNTFTQTPSFSNPTIGDCCGSVRVAIRIYGADTTVAPEPASFSLVGSGLLALGLLVHKNARRG